MEIAKQTPAISRTLWWYACAVLAFWVVDPEIRRLLEWHGGLRAFELLSIVPMVALAPLAIVGILRAGTLPPRLLLLLWIWLGSFLYAGLLGWLLGLGRSAMYDFLQFVAPMFIALCVSGSDEGRSQVFRRASTLILFLAVFVALYGILQYVALPAWDAVWMQQVLRVAGMVTNGTWSAFQVRVFSVLNSPTPCATFLAAAIAINLYRLQENRIIPLAGMFLCVVTLTLTLVRSAWIALIVALITYFLLGKRPARAAAVMAALSFLVVSVFVLVTPWVSAQTGQDIVSKRVQTLWNLRSDTSANERTAVTQELLNQGIEHPLGQGLGIIGTAARLSNVTESVNSMDGGLQARFAEMGVMGFAGYIAALLLALMFTLQRWWEARQSGDDAASDMLAAALAVQTALIAMDLSVDAHVNIIGALFWITVGISLTGSGAVVRVHDKDVNSSYARSPA